MRKVKGRHIIVLIIVVILVTFFFVGKGLRKENNEFVENQGTKKTTELIINNSYELKKIVIKDNSYTNIDIEYPYFENADEKFNIDIENFIKEKIENHKIISEENWTARYDNQLGKENIPKTPKEEEKFYLHSTPEIVQSNLSYISFVLKIDGYEGGAHGYVNDFSFNYDLKNKKEIKLKDLFSNNMDYLKYLSDESRKYLKEKYLSLTEEDRNGFNSEEDIKQYQDNLSSMIDSGTESIENNFQIFTFSENKVKIYFSQYQVGPYVMGMPTFEIEIK